MGLRDLWSNYKVLIVMGTSLGLIHWGWYNLKGNPLLVLQFKKTNKQLYELTQYQYQGK
uniref:Uncharacterized protein n=1 Tax=Oreochromis niloticus TaxID=8128 RepID=A0A669DSH8_ORENI